MNGRLRAQIRKELLSLLRDPKSRVALFVPPLLQLCVFAFAATLEVDNVAIAVYDEDAGVDVRRALWVERTVWFR